MSTTTDHQNNAVIDSIEFGILSPEDIKNMSVVRIFSNKLSGPNSIYDDAMGPIDNGKICPSCSCDNKTCPGHFGHIELNYKIIHPLYYRIVLLFLKCYCVKCSSCLLTPDQLKLAGLLKLTKENRFVKIVERCEKIDVCPLCQAQQPKILYVASESNIYMNYKTKDETIRTQLTEQEIENIFQNISEESISMLGLNPQNTHPKNLILSCLPVIPPIARPYVVSDSVTCDDDLTLQYLEILKTNNHLEDHSQPESKKAKYIQSLKFRIKCLFDNSQDKAKHTNGRPVKSIKKRITGKEGQIRNHLMGKRVNKSGRTVIGPDATVGLGEIGLPPEMSRILTYPERVNRFNIDKLSETIASGNANFVQRGEQRINLRYAMFRKGTELLYGDVVQRTHNGKQLKLVNDENNTVTLKEGDRLFRNGKEIPDLSFPTKREFAVRIGDIVQRHLRDGDIVLLNRQPTLHKGSMLAQRIRIIKGKTIRMNLAITKTFNADFDGDEMNIHAPSTPECVAELQELSATKHNLISEQSSKPNITIVQDALLGNYLMTRPGPPMTRDRFFQISCAAKNMSSTFILNKIQRIRRVMKAKGKRIQAYTGKGLFSLLLPDDLNYVRENKGNPTEPVVRIYKGVLWEGTINKAILGSSHGSLIQILYKEYSADVAVEFINNVQFIAYAWLLVFGFSIGIDDCVATKTSEIEHVVTKSFVEAQGVEETTTNPLIREVKVAASLSKARDNGMKIAKEALGLDNNFVSTVTSGSKGDFFNIAQITGVLGQQNFSGARIPKTMTNCTRTLPFYPLEQDDEDDTKPDPLTKELEYESRGFIRNSFIHGINPREFWFHAVTGREGVTDTAMKTAQSGYIQRRMVKVGEDVAVKYDGTVRNAGESIIQFNYGNNSLDPAKTVIVDGKPQICDVSRLADRINLAYE
jgi:DNA-directed RNA polymerase beta' subunit